MLWIVFGTRPEWIKLDPLVRLLTIPHRLICTGQHTTLLASLGLPMPPDMLSLNLPGTNQPKAYASSVKKALQDLADSIGEPSLVLVQGDTASAFGAMSYAVSAGDTPHRARCAHVEAGLRSWNDHDPEPEEYFRRTIDDRCQYRFAPTTVAQDNLRQSHKFSWVTGNTITDALRLQHLPPNPHRRGVLVTLHRRESFGQPLKNILTGLIDMARHRPDLPFTWPLHPNPRIQDSLKGLSLPTNVHLVPPMPYPTFLRTLHTSQAVLTDSGGLTEEACTLGIPTVLARNTTERPEAISEGTAHLAGTQPAGIAHALRWALNASPKPSTVYGDGHCAQRILTLLTQHCLCG